ncbi:MAG: hypothetical protein FJ304_10365 [Planctomycetes bacterium]|nr:hypothetical protein [Planctomycetota bacterium]
MSPRRAALLLTALLCAQLLAPTARAADPKDIEAAIQKGAAFLKKNAGDGGKGKRDEDHLGARALAGLALLETGTAPDDPAVRAITAAVRDAAFSEVRTYQLTLFVLYLDRLGDPNDRALVQMMGVRLVAGQNADGGWTYACVPPVPAATEKLLRAKLGEATLVAGKGPAVPKPDAPKPGAPAVAGRLHTEVEKYRQGLLTAERTGKGRDDDDNSNTQFGILGVWVARRYAVPVETALERIEKRFLGTQTASGGWPYSGPRDGSPSMTCAGLLGLATAIGRREERALRADVPKPAPKKPDEPAKPFVPPPGTDPNDPFYNPPPPKAVPAPDPAPKKPADPPAPKRAKPDARDDAVARGMDNLAAVLAGGPVGGGKGKGKKGGDLDLYFYWSLERVGVVFGVEKIGKTDWYEYGANRLLPMQNADGSFGARAGYGPDVNTAFALLFLARANPVRDLSAKVQRNLGNAEMRAGAGAPAPAVVAKPAPEPAPLPHAKPAEPDPRPVAKPATTPGEIAAELFRATGAPWVATLQRVRDAKGGENTSALLAVIPLLDGDRMKQARDALAERLCRMSANTLRGMLRADDAELRRAAALACAMKDDRDHVPDLIGLIEDSNADVVRAARAALKSLTGQDLATAAAWRAWLNK